MLRRKRKKTVTSGNPEVQEAMDERDALIEGVKGAVAKVDRLKDELLKEYTEANGVERWSSPQS